MNKSLLLCQSCGWKIISDLSNLKLYELKSDTMSARKFRCPQCGRAIAPRPISDPQGDLDRKKEDDKLEAQKKEWMSENIQFQKEFMKEAHNE